jgi:hypothetical protein
MAMIGKREAVTERLAVRKHGTGSIGSLTISELARQLKLGKDVTDVSEGLGLAD